MSQKRKKREATLGEDIIAGLQEIVDYKKGKLDLRTTSVIMPEPPKALSKNEIQKLRVETLKMSQALFARWLGVSPATVKAWEQGANSPKGPALRLLHLAKKDKKAFLELASA